MVKKIISGQDMMVTEMRCIDMTKEMKEKYKDAKPIATYCLSNWGGIEILDILYGIDDYVVSRYYGKELHCNKINYGVKHSSFRIGRLTIRLDECMRV